MRWRFLKPLLLFSLQNYTKIFKKSEYEQKRSIYWQIKWNINNGEQKIPKHGSWMHLWIGQRMRGSIPKISISQLSKCRGLLGNTFRSARWMRNASVCYAKYSMLLQLSHFLSSIEVVVKQPPETPPVKWQHRIRWVHDELEGGGEHHMQGWTMWP